MLDCKNTLSQIISWWKNRTVSVQVGDHIFVLCTILRNRKLSGQETFLSFIDFQKAFDSVDRKFLMYKLSQIGINGHMYNTISSLYYNPRSRVILNDFETNYFDCPIFAIFTNEPN